MIFLELAHFVIATAPKRSCQSPPRRSEGPRDERRMATNPSTYSPSSSSESRQQKRRLFQKTDWTRCRPACLYPLSLYYALELFDVLPTRRTLEELTLCRAVLGSGAANSASGSAYPAFGATTVIVSV